ETGIALPPANEAIKHVMRDLRQCQQRNEDAFEGTDLPRAAEQPAALVPDAAVPEHLLHIGDQPEQAEKRGQCPGMAAPRTRIRSDRNRANGSTRPSTGSTSPSGRSQRTASLG